MTLTEELGSEDLGPLGTDGTGGGDEGMEPELLFESSLGLDSASLGLDSASLGLESASSDFGASFLAGASPAEEKGNSHPYMINSNLYIINHDRFFLLVLSCTSFDICLTSLPE